MTGNTMVARKRALIHLCVVLSVTTALIQLPGPARAATTRVESETLTPPPECWSRLDYARLSGGAGRFCGNPAAGLTWTVAAQAGDVVSLHGYRDDVVRTFRARIDGGEWIDGVVTGGLDHSARFFTSPALPAGNHTFELRSGGAGALTFDFFEVANTGQAPATTTTTTAPATTTTTPAPITTTTTTLPVVATVKTEAESIPSAGPCWTALSYMRFSGGAARSCYALNQALTWTVGARAGDVLTLYGYRDAVERGFRVRISGGPWTQGAFTGDASFASPFFTSEPLAAGDHGVELEWVASAGGFTLDYYELRTSGSPGPTTTTTVPTTTTTTVATTTTTTKVPATTTTTITPVVTGNAVCPIAPADGQAAISAAIAGCPNGSTVQFPAGAVYHQTSYVDVPDRANLVIDGNGSTFLNSAPNVEAMFSNWRLLRGRNVTLRNMTLEGNFKLQGPRSLPVVSAIAVNQRNSGIFVLGGDGITIADVKVRDIFGDMVTIVPSNFRPTGMTPAETASSEIPRNVRIVRLDGTRAARQCIGLAAAIGFWLEDSTLRDCWYGGVDLERDYSGEPHRDIHILRNTFDGYNLFAIAGTAPGFDGDTTGVEIRGNRTLTPGDSCIPTVLIGYYPDNPSRFVNVTIEDNEVLTLYKGITVDHVQNGAVRNNRIEKLAPDTLCGPPAGQSVVQTNSNNVTVSGNTAVGFSG